MDINYCEFKLNKCDKNANVTIALGSFLCFHLGHLELIKAVKEISETTNTNSAILCLSPLNLKNNIMTIEDKKEYLTDMGIQKLINVDFTENFKLISFHDFINFLKNTLKVINVVVGEDFRFGFNRQGTIEDLKRNFNVKIIKLKKQQQGKISTSEIIKKIQNGNIEEVNSLLGFNYRIKGIVQKGRQNGRKINFPTLNIPLENYLVPKYGVYSALLHYKNELYLGMAYIGKHRTIDTLSSPILEIHVFEFNKNLYGEFVIIELLDRISDDFQFENLEQLKSALGKYKSIILKKHRLTKNQRIKCSK